MTTQTTQQILNNPNYQELVSKRSRFAWMLTAIMLLVYFSFILLIAFFPEVLGAKVSEGSMMTVGIPVGIAIIVFAFALTGIYVRRANREFDVLLEAVKKGVEV